MPRPANILLVEDSAGDAQLTQEAIDELGLSMITLHVARDGEAAIQYLESSALPDLIILDLNLPKMNGKEVLLCVKTSERLKAIPIIVLSTSMAPEDVKRSYELHANCYITKPTDLDAFIDMIARIADFWLDLVTPAPKAVE